MRLFEITEQYKALIALEDNDEVTPEFIADTLEGLEGDFEEKAVAVAKFILSLEANADAIMAAIDAMELRAARIQKRATSVKHYLLLQMQIVQTKKIQAPEFVISRRASPPAVYVGDEAMVPAEFWRQPPAPPPQIDKAGLKKALDAGREIVGCFIESGEHLRITL